MLRFPKSYTKMIGTKKIAPKPGGVAYIGQRAVNTSRKSHGTDATELSEVPKWSQCDLDGGEW